jgi:hypothetical protein
MDLAQLLRLLNSRGRISVPVGRVELLIAKAIGAETDLVLLSKDTLIKQCERHPDIRAVQYAMLQKALDVGLVLVERANPKTAAICYQDPTDETKRYRLQIKRTEDRKSIYLTSFHRTQPRQTRALLKRSRIVRSHR